MNRVVILITLLVVVIAGSLTAAETSVHGRLYTHWEYDMTEGADGMNDFGLGRAYITVKSKLSEFTSIRITSDLRETTIIDENDNGQTRYDVIIKYGYLDWQPAFANKSLKLRIGLQPTPYIDFQNKLWGRRYLSKTVGDKNKFLTTSDPGLSAYIKLGEKGKFGSVTLGLFNGTSYSNLGDLNKQKDMNLFVQLNPFSNSEELKQSAIVAQYYKGTQNVETNDSTLLSSDYHNDIFSVGALVAYNSLFHIGADMNWHTKGMGTGMAEMKESGVSVHGTLFLGELVGDSELLKDLNLFGRSDIYDPNTGIDNNSEKLFIVGVECHPTQGFKASLNFRSTSFDEVSKETEKQLFVNTLFKF